MTSMNRPQSLRDTPKNRSIEYCCPQCKGALESLPDSYICEGCGSTYPLVAGIPDFRIFPDPYIDIQNDREKALDIAAKFDSTDFRGLIEYYWSITPHNHPTLVDRYVRNVLTGVPRGEQFLAAIGAALPGEIAGDEYRILEIGCGTGGFLVAARRSFYHVVGIDIAFRWLVVAKKRLEECAVNAQLVCCCAEYLPFPGEQFDLIVAGDVLEHTKTQQELIEESYRALRHKGVFFAATPNRLSLTPDPHFRLWGVGWLPRSLARRYVTWFRDVPYDKIRLLSQFELKRLVGRTAFRRCRIALPTFSEAEQEGLSAREKWLIRIYHATKDWPVIRFWLMIFGPVFQVLCIRENNTKSDGRTV